MLFNSHEFLFVFLPLTVLGYYRIKRSGAGRLALSWLLLASIIFYGYWLPRYLILIGFSTIFNYAAGFLIAAAPPGRSRKMALAAGVGVNLALLGYFKYAGFLVATVCRVFALDIHVGQIILPLAISFYTFQQISYLVDVFRSGRAERDFFAYALFVMFFPQLIAGPIVRFDQMMPQFCALAGRKFRHDDLAVGMMILTIGLFKKVILADGIAGYAAAVFHAADSGEPVTLVSAWGGVLAYALQLYFDFSGYSDMAIGLGRLFGIVLPLNFHSPYKSTSIIEFWRRWHMTLSRFLRDYLYIPLGGSRQGNFRHFSNMMITMLLGGLWHGAGWMFVLWGGAHGLMIVVNYGWRRFLAVRRIVIPDIVPVKIGMTALTFAGVVMAWVLFRAETLGGAGILFKGLTGFNGVQLGARWLTLLGQTGIFLQAHAGWDFTARADYFGGYPQFVHTLALLAIIWLFPNTQQIMREYEPAINFSASWPVKWWERWLRWSPTGGWALASAVLFVWTVGNLVKYSEFLYFQF